MPKCDVCRRTVKDITGSVMTYKHGRDGSSGFTCGDCIVENEYKLVSRRQRVTLLSTLLEDESKEASYERDKV